MARWDQFPNRRPWRGRTGKDGRMDGQQQYGQYGQYSNTITYNNINYPRTMSTATSDLIAADRPQPVPTHCHPGQDKLLVDIS